MSPESDIDEMIKTYWGRLTEELGFENEEDLDMWIEDAVPRFVNPTADTPTSLAEFVRWLDPEPLIELLAHSYKDFNRVKKRLPARVRFFAYFVLSGEVYLTRAYRQLNEAGYRALGFEKRPTYESVREFIYERIGRKRFKAFFNKMVKELCELFKMAGISLGQRTSQDATDLPSLKEDSEAEYNGYYKEYGYKADVTIDLDHGVPLDYEFTGINECEERNLIPSLEHLAIMKIRPKEHKVDGSYATFKNIAWTETKDIHLVYRIQDGWVEKPEIDESEIKRCYQQYHNEPDFHVDPNLGFMLRYLQKKGKDELVGNFYRNKVMTFDGTSQQEHDKSCNERRVKMEGFYGVAKCFTQLGKRPPRRGRDATRFLLDITMLAFVFAVLIRVQNGVFTNLCSLGYFG